MSAMIGTLSAAETISQSCRQSILIYRGLFPRLLDFGFERNGVRTGDATVFADPPEVHNHKDQSDDGNADAVPDVRAEQRVGVDDRAAEQAKANIVVGRHAELGPERPFVTEKRSGAGHIGADGY